MLAQTRSGCITNVSRDEGATQRELLIAHTGNAKPGDLTGREGASQMRVKKGRSRKVKRGDVHVAIEEGSSTCIGLGLHSWIYVPNGKQGHCRLWCRSGIERRLKAQLDSPLYIGRCGVNSQQFGQSSSKIAIGREKHATIVRSMGLQ